jgi:UDP-N-acetylmuramate dehydrogenase
VDHKFQLQENVSLAPLTTLNIGGPARYFVRAENEGTVVEALRFAEGQTLPVFILGGGSNLLVSDDGFDGLVLQIALRGTEREETEGSILVTAAAGEDWDKFVAWCVADDLAGVECLSGIPGFLGGTPVQNVGAYGQEVAETIVSVRCYDTKARQFVALTNAECGFTYRTSIFNTTERGRHIVLSVTYALERGGAPKVVYKDLIEHFAARQPSLAEVRDAVLNIRRGKSMVIDARDPNSKSAGSFFKNPVVTWDKYHQIKAGFERVPHFEFGDEVKIPAAWLIENAGFDKGFAHGNAGISTNHTLALINRGDATAIEMIELKDLVQTAVKEKFGIELLPEPVFVGF